MLGLKEFNERQQQMSSSQRQNINNGVSTCNLSRIADRTQRSEMNKEEEESILDDFGVLLNDNNKGNRNHNNNDDDWKNDNY